MEHPQCDDPMTYSPSGASNHEDVAARPLSDTKYDVFVSFRGEDIRDNLLSHLTEAFKPKNIEYFVDYHLKEGADVWPSLKSAIEGSFISLVIFSDDYGCSDWCLKELVEILECRKKYGQTVIPVFYKIQPTNVRHQDSVSYKKVFDELEKIHDSTLVKSWRDAMENAANKSGIVSTNFRTDNDLVKKIVASVYSALRESSKHSSDSNVVLVGIDEHIKHLETLLRRQESKKVRVIGIWGEGGMGKTTVAGAVFSKLFSEYDSGCFLPDVKKDSERISLKRQVFSKLLPQIEVKIDSPIGLPEYIERMIRRRKVLIVLDDVKDSGLLNDIFGSLDDLFKSGGRIILTSRNKQVLIANGVYVDDVYHVSKMSFSDALQLFKLNAFSQNNLIDSEYLELSKRVVEYANCIPLVLKVLGLLLRGKDKEVWKSQLNKLEKMPIEEVHNKMKLSYDDLDPKEKKIFLDLACFFCECNLKVDDIKDLLKDSESDNSVHVELESLKDKALITISEDRISMHDIIKQMGQEIVRQESIDDPQRRSRLWHEDDIHKVLQNNQGTEAIRSIGINLPRHSRGMQLSLSSHVFANMSKLRFLVFRSVFYSESLLDLPQGLESFPSALRYLFWECYPLKSLPENFAAGNLVILDLRNSKVQKLWDGVQNLVNIKSVNLESCFLLKELPDLSKASNLEVLNASCCHRLTEVHPSILFLNKLKTLNLDQCISLTRLVSTIHMRSLSFLNLRFCEQLRGYSVISENMKELNLRDTRVNALPSSFGCQRKLEILHLVSCQDIESLPSSIKSLTRLRYLDIRRCKKLRNIPELPPYLETFVADSCESLETISFPSTPIESMTRVEFWNCLKLNQDSLVAIGLNAQASVTNFARQHLSALEHNCAANNFHDYDDEYHSYQAKCVHPGIHVPNWFAYQKNFFGPYPWARNDTTKHHDIVIDLSSTPRSNALGFILCFVVNDYNHLLRRDQSHFDRSLVFHITVSDYKGKGKSQCPQIYMHIPFTVGMGSNHVCTLYDQRFSWYLNSKAKDLTRFQIEATVTNMDPSSTPVLTSFGICPISSASNV